MKKIVRLTEGDLYRIIKESVERIVMNEDYPFSPDEDKQDKIDRYERRMKQLRDDWEDKHRRIRQKFPGKSNQWYEDNLDLFEEVGAGGGGATSDVGLNGDGSGDPSMGVAYPAFGVQRRKIYKPKDPTLKRKNGKNGSISIPKERA